MNIVMKNLGRIIAILLSILFFGYIFYTYEPVKKTEKSIEEKNKKTWIMGIL